VQTDHSEEMTEVVCRSRIPMTLADIERKGYRIGRLQWTVPKRCWALCLFYAVLYIRVPLVALMKVAD
jgi:hypothetical protein